MILPGSRDSERFSPVFILAPARAHSTVVNAMIGAHPELHAFPELALFRRATVGEMTSDPPGFRGPEPRARHAGLLRALAHLHDGEESEATIELAWSWLEERPGWSGADVYDHLLDTVSPLAGVENSPDDSNREASLARLVVAYPRARFVHLVRHPVPSAASMHRVWQGLDYWTIPPELLHTFCVGVWYYQHRRIDHLVASVGSERALRVRAEDVLNDPTAVLPRICRWLGVDDSDAAIEAMRHPERGPHARLGPPSALGGGDFAFMEQPVPHAVELGRSLDVPTEWRVDPWLLTAVCELAHRFGYTHEVEPSG